jgi:hypothetical protein
MPSPMCRAWRSVIPRSAPMGRRRSGRG